LLAGLVLAFGTGAVFAGVVAVAGLVAVITGVNVAAQGLGPALFNGLHHLQVAGGEAALELGAIGRTVLAENLGQLDHGKSAINWLMTATALAAPCWVKCV
jgi:hypothetical protein